MKDSRRIAWSMQNNGQRGKAKIRNISVSGMQMETDKLLDPYEQCVLSFDSDLGMKNYIPKTGRLVWYKKNRWRKDRYLCGVKFVEPTGFILPKLQKKIKSKFQHIGKTHKLGSALKVLFYAVIIALTGYTVWMTGAVFQGMREANQQMTYLLEQQTVLTQEYALLYQESHQKLLSAQSELKLTKMMYQESENTLVGVSQELEQTRNILSRTVNLLAQAEKNNVQLEGGLETVKHRAVEIKQKLNQAVLDLQGKNIQLGREMVVLRDQLEFYDDNIENLDEANSLVSVYHQKLKLVKSKIKELKRDSDKVRRQALREQDRVKMALGNNGYFMKDGESVNVDVKKYQAAASDSSQATVAVQARPKVNIDVEFFQ